MTSSMTPLHAEHRELAVQLTALATTADCVGTAEPPALATLIASSLAFLNDELRPHAEAEDVVLYPVVARLMGSAEATATMRRDHEEVLALTAELEQLHAQLIAGPLDEQLANGLRRVLYGLFAVISLHFAAEEEIYLPLLEDGLANDEADALMQAMQRAHDELAARRSANHL